jgi:hypothetical protein
MKSNYQTFLYHHGKSQYEYLKGKSRQFERNSCILTYSKGMWLMMLLLGMDVDVIPQIQSSLLSSVVAKYLMQLLVLIPPRMNIK